MLFRRLSALLLVSVALAACTDETVAESDSGVPTVPPAAVCKADADCPAPNPCATGVCVAGQCQAKTAADGTACSDGNVCNGGDTCKAGQCTAGATLLACDDGNTCTQDVCDPKVGCVSLPQPSLCNDDNPCTDDTCVAGKGCEHANNTAPCFDANPCTVGEACKDGKCQGGAAPKCDDGNPCTDDFCDPAFGCTAKNNTAACEDGDACSTGDVCLDGTCRKGLGKVVCDDKNPCTQDSCDPASGCVTAKIDGPCSDGDACTVGDLCGDGACLPGTATVCDDGNACTDDSCDKTKGCVSLPNSVTCTDGDACTEGDVCATGKCAPGKAKNCDDGNACTNDACDPAAGCQQVANTAACNDGNLCTTGDACAAKACKAGAGALPCDDKNPCTTDTCDPVKGCVFTNNTDPCDDADPTTQGDKCTAGVCKGATANQPTCENYCDAVTTACTGANTQYANKAACLSYCKQEAKLPAGQLTDKAGNTIGCRLYHASLALTNATLHCPHAGKSGGNMCGTWCDNYCHLATTNCTNGNALYANAGACAAACGQIPAVGLPGDVTGNTVQCRIEHLGAAGQSNQSAVAMCPIGKSPDPTQTCVDAAPVSKNWMVMTKGFAFDPPDLTIAVGDTVTFTMTAIHTATEVAKATWDANGSTPKAGGFKVNFGETKTVPFSSAGTYYYVCEPHAGGGMKGMITVK